jgi:hypothetical protein
MSVEDQFLARLARGGLVSQDEYDQLFPDLPPEAVASALALRYQASGDLRVLVEAARLYAHAGFDYHVLELCSRSPHAPELHRLLQKTLPRVRQDYPDTRLVGKLLDEAFLVIDLDSGQIIRFPPLLPAV